MFPSTAHWQPLVALGDIVAELENPTFSKHHAPTIEMDQAEFILIKHNFTDTIPIKHNFTGTFEHPDFKGEYEVFDRGCNCHVKLDKD